MTDNNIMHIMYLHIKYYGRIYVCFMYIKNVMGHLHKYVIKRERMCRMHAVSCLLRYLHINNNGMRGIVKQLVETAATIQYVGFLTNNSRLDTFKSQHFSKGSEKV